MPNSRKTLKEPALECAARTDVGLIRERNEDTLWIDPAEGWLLLADGMGGYSAGDLASALAVSYVSSRLRNDAKKDADRRKSDRTALLVESLVDANTAIRAACGKGGADVMGSTFVGALLRPDEVTCVYVGDSRLYLLRAGALTQLSRDHTVVQEFVDAGRLSADTAQNHPYRGLLTRGLGVSEIVEPETGIYSLQAGDRLLLCSDGLTDMVDEDEIARLLGAPLSADDVAMSLIEAAKRGGGRDNVSVIVAWFAAAADN